MLPCKPDQASRTVPLGAQEVQMRMLGCEADGALFALSHVQAGERSQVPALLNAWRTTTLANLGSAMPTPLPIKVTPAKQPNAALSAVLGGGQTDFPPERVAVTGKGADGSPIQAQLAWVVDGVDVYQIAVYGPRVTLDMTESLFSEIQIQ